MGCDVTVKEPHTKLVTLKTHQKMLEDESAANMRLCELSVNAVRDGEDKVGRRGLLCSDCSSESKVNSELQTPPSHFP